MIFVPPELDRILRQTPELRKAWLVGGCVRDGLLGCPGKDFDVEVFGIGFDSLAQALSRWGKVDLVGQSFGVVKLATGGGESYDFAVPRRDSKIAAGHKGFAVKLDPAITPAQAAARRDFTINSLMFDPRTGEMLDFFGGAADLEARILRHTGPAFVEDPLRILRGMQLAARFNLQPAVETVELCRRIKDGFSELAGQRVRDEWFKWAEKSAAPSAGLKFLAATGWVDHFPEIKDLIGTPQDPEWHPEGDVFVHTGHACDAMARLPEWKSAGPESRRVLMLAILAHDFGKPATTQQVVKDGRRRIVSPGHDALGGKLAQTFLERIHAPPAIQARVVPLVVNHIIHNQTLTDRALRRLAKRLEPENINGLCLVMTADGMGRPPKPAAQPDSVKRLLARARELQVQEKPPEPILMGRHLAELGLPPGKDYGVILDRAYEAQLEGVFFDLTRALEWLRDQDDLPLSASVRRELEARRREGGTHGD
jgi:tRNA nucleotidyltransferase (CCA-adding enzyme)